MLKWLLRAIVVLALVLGALAAFNYERLIRVSAVLSLFSEDKIVNNFSNMNGPFESVPVPSAGDDEPWETAPSPRAVTYSYNGKIKNVEDWLEQTKTTSLIVVRDGVITNEDYYLGTSADDLRVSWSLAKSFLSATFGVAVGKGRINIDETVETYVPTLKGSADEGAKVRDVLTMSSGIEFNEDYLDFWSDINQMGRVLALGGSLDAFTEGQKEREREPGTAWKYVSIDTHVLSMVLRAATGKTLPEYMAERLITPIGFEKQPYFVSDSHKNAFSLGGLNATSRDYARFAQMILQEGQWNGKQIVPADWIRTSTSAIAPAPADVSSIFGYGYQWWIPPMSDGTHSTDEVLGRGIYGQYIYINRSVNTVIIKTSAHRGFRNDGEKGKLVHLETIAMFRSIAGINN